MNIRDYFTTNSAPRVRSILAFCFFFVVVKCFETFRIVVKFSEMLWDVQKCCEMFIHVVKCSEMLWKFWTCHNSDDHFTTFLNIFTTFVIISRHFIPFHNISELFKHSWTSHIISDFFITFLNISQLF